MVIVVDWSRLAKLPCTYYVEKHILNILHDLY